MSEKTIIKCYNRYNDEKNNQKHVDFFKGVQLIDYDSENDLKEESLKEELDEKSTEFEKGEMLKKIIDAGDNPLTRSSQSD